MHSGVMPNLTLKFKKVHTGCSNTHIVRCYARGVLFLVRTFCDAEIKVTLFISKWGYRINVPAATDFLCGKKNRESQCLNT
jgi:hypothetical protein